MSGPEERDVESAESYERDLDDIEVAEQLADESRDCIWLSQSIDALPWPKALTVYSVEVRGFKP